jgi:hypothetical protein
MADILHPNDELIYQRLSIDQPIDLKEDECHNELDPSGLEKGSCLVTPDGSLCCCCLPLPCCILWDLMEQIKLLMLNYAWSFILINKLISNDKNYLENGLKIKLLQKFFSSSSFLFSRANSLDDLGYLYDIRP